MPKNNPTYDELAVELLMTQKEKNALRMALRKAYAQQLKLERELEDERYRHDRQIDWYLARERKLEAKHGKT